LRIPSLPSDPKTIAGSDFKGVKLALDDSTGMDGIAIPDDIAAEGGRP
jgi:hypothetical protein